MYEIRIYYICMSIDSLNNSQVMLLVLLISLVVSAATAVATLSVVYERVDGANTLTAQPTIIKQTVNRIIERSPVPAVAVPEVVSVEREVLTLADMERSLVRIYQSTDLSEPVAVGIIVSSDGTVLASGMLDAEVDEESSYAVVLHGSGEIADLETESVVSVFVSAVSEHYTLLLPLHAYTPEAFVPVNTSEISIGQTSFVFGGFGDAARLHSEIISQKEGGAEVTRVRTSATVSAIALPSAVFVDRAFVGFITESSGWVPTVDRGFFDVS